jgi:hypothetical protein
MKENEIITEEQVEDYVETMAGGSGWETFVLSVIADIATGTYTPEQLRGDIEGIDEKNGNN